MRIIFRMLKKVKFLIKKLTLFDKIVIALVIFGVFIFAYIFFRKSSYITVTLKVGEDNIYYPYGTSTTPYIAQVFYKGMQEKDGFGRIQAEVLDVSSYMLRSNATTVYLKTKLKTTYSRSNNQHLYKGTPVLIGSQLSLYLTNVSIDALVTNIEGNISDNAKKILLAEAVLLDQNMTFLETAGVFPFISDAIKIGDVQLDSQNSIVIKVLDKVVKPAVKTVTNASGQVFVQQDPIRKDVALKLEIHATEIGGRYYIFDDQPVSIGEAVPICSSMICYYPTITKIDESK